MRSKILNMDFEYKATHLGLTVSPDLYLSDKYSVMINGYLFEYSMGIGYRKALRGFGRDSEFNRIIRIEPKKTRENILSYVSLLEQCSAPTPPELDDVLYSLLLDSEALDYTFEDWADNLGYDKDSRSAESIYFACKDNGQKLRKFIPDLERARELFQDY